MNGDMSCCCVVAWPSVAALFHTAFLQGSMMIKCVRWCILKIENRTFTENWVIMPFIFWGLYKNCKKTELKEVDILDLTVDKMKRM